MQTAQRILYDFIEKAEKEWTPTTDKNTLPDEVANIIVEAYNSGKQARQNALREIFERKLNRASEASANFFQTIQQEFKIELEGLFLKVRDITSFEAAILIPDEIYNTDTTLQLIERSYDLEEQLREDEANAIEMYFKFMPYRPDSLNLPKLFANGFTLKYDQKRAAAA